MSLAHWSPAVNRVKCLMRTRSFFAHLPSVCRPRALSLATGAAERPLHDQLVHFSSYRKCFCGRSSHSRRHQPSEVVAYCFVVLVIISCCCCVCTVDIVCILHVIDVVLLCHLVMMLRRYLQNTSFAFFQVNTIQKSATCLSMEGRFGRIRVDCDA